MLALTPLIEPLSIDEAFLDLTGTERLHGMSAAKALARFAAQIEKELGITVSIGLSANKFLAKIASDMDKPRGFAVLGLAEAAAFLAPKPVGFIYGEEGARLWHLARGIDARAVDPERDTKSISAETTFERDIGEFRPLEHHLWELTERVSARLKANALAGSTVTLKLKSADFKIRTRARALGPPTQLAARIFAAGRDLLAHEVGTTRFRLIGIGVSHLEEAAGDDLADLIERRHFALDGEIGVVEHQRARDAVLVKFETEGIDRRLLAAALGRFVLLFE